ncbi:tetratricopeptide repeat-containing sulfotransferase family protein [Thalassotalea sediminis]|uniref:tetratricopeptide repeat-containing sulfotransferase family protein n=1 Tax=Thalassotalea sediminis TaxID=1759089 RepID=UPI002572D094|nr:tetratricopeptide repeat-containing sulfotransferase family protein [Thalassotalea sediminis]
MKSVNKIKKARELAVAGQYQKALKELKKERKLSLEATFLKIELLNTLKEYPLAIFEAEMLLKKNLDDKQRCQLHLFIGICYKKQGKYSAAISSIEQSVLIDGGISNGSAVYNLAFLYLTTLNVIAFERVSLKLLHWEKFYIGTHVMRIRSAVLQQNMELVKQRLNEIQPYAHLLDAAQFGKVATYYFDFKMYAELSVLIEKYERINPGSTLGFKAKVAFESQEYDKVIGMLDNHVLEQANNPTLDYMVADSYHQLKQFSNAQIYYQQAATKKAKEVRHKKVKPSNYQVYKSLAKGFANEVEVDEYNVFTNITFIAGFPRSGTTLIDNIIDTQENVLVFSETGVFQTVISAFKDELNKRYPQDMFRLTKDEINYLRGVYFETVAKLGFDYAKYQMIVEKSPHYSCDLPFINLIFPEANLIFMQRHPLDVCLSCFQKDFVASSENIKLIEIRSIIDTYIEVHKLIAMYEKELKLPIYRLSYEALVNNFEQECRKLFSAIKLNVDDTFSNFSEHAKNKYVTSASRGQTNQPIYQSSMNKWVNYKALFEPYWGKITSCVESLGYDCQTENVKESRR